LPGFIAPLAFDAGTSPLSVAVGDFNGDGIPDLAVANAPSGQPGTVSVLLGNGDGSFQPARSYSAGSGSLAVGDFNGDGNLDIVTGTVILLGNGDGTFQDARNHGGTGGPVAVGDFNGDGNLDLAVVNGSSGSVSVLLGNGDGSFQPASNFSTGYRPTSVAVGDFNGDGNLDLAVGNGGDVFNPGYSVSVLLGNGDGSFRPRVDYGAGPVPVYVAVGDFNGDGRLDLAVADNGTFPLFIDGGVSVLLGNGDGSFRPLGTLRTGVNPRSVAVGDFNGDGRQDLAVTNGTYGASTVSVLLGNGDGSFQPARNFSAGYGPSSVAVGDFNGDGRLDLAVANQGGANVRVLLGNGGGSFQAAPNYSAGSVPQSVAVGDFNGDGKLDLAVTGYGFQCDEYGCVPVDETVRVLLGNGDGSFQPARSYSAGSRPSFVAVGDFNGDGIPDLAVANYGDQVHGVPGSVSVLLGNGDGSFQPARNFSAGSGPYSVAVGDFDGDGRLDLAVTDGGDNSGNGQGVSVLLGNGDGSFQPPRTFSAGIAPSSVAVGDFDGDGRLDLAVANVGSNNVSVLLGNGDGTFRPAVNYAAGTYPGSVAVGDFNGDGIPDLAVANVGSNNVSVLLGNGDGTFRPAANYAAGTYPGSVAVEDFNGDGKLDLALLSSGTARVLLGNGDGTFQTTHVGYAVGNTPSSVAVGDFNGDGLPDLAAANAGSDDVSILVNDGAWTGPHPRPGGGAPGGGRPPGPRPRPGTPPALPAPLAEAVVRVDPTAAAQPPGATVSLGAGGRPPLGADAVKGGTPAARAEARATQPPALAPVLARARDGGAARWLADRLFAEPDSGWLWDRPAEGPWPAGP
jgi:hypothetical protein